MGEAPGEGESGAPGAGPGAAPLAGWRRYGPAWTARPVRRAFAGTLAARMAQTMISLTLLLLFRQRTGSFAAAGLAVAATVLAGAALPAAAAVIVPRVRARPPDQPGFRRGGEAGEVPPFPARSPAREREPSGRTRYG